MSRERFWSHEPTLREKTEGWMYIFQGLGACALEFVTKQFTHEGISSHLPEVEDAPPRNPE